MPFVSDKQKKWMYANKPAMAKKWQKETDKKKVSKAATKHMGRNYS